MTPDSFSIAPGNPDDADARELIGELGESLRLSTGRFSTTSYGAADLLVPRSTFVIARANDGTPLGCGAVRPYTERIAELKRMYARPETKGVGSAILEHLEATARAWGYEELWLETGTTNTHAIAFYERHGYTTIPTFAPYLDRANAVCFAKRLLAD